MSLRAVKTVLPEFNLSQPIVFAYPQPAASTTYNHYNFDSVSNTNASISLTTPGYTNNLLSRNAYKEITVQLEYDVTPNTPAVYGQNAYQSAHVCPRSWPVDSSLQSESVQINNYTNNVNPAQLIDIMTRYGDFEAYLQTGFETVTQKDDTQKYDSSIIQSANSPFAAAATSRDNEPPRNATSLNIVQNPTLAAATTSTVKLLYTFMEPIITPPFQYTFDSGAKSLAWVNTLTFNWTFGDTTRMFSFMDATYLSSLGFNITNIKCNVQSGQLYLKWQTLPIDSPPIPEEVIYDYNQIDVYTQTINNTYTADSTMQLTFSNVSLRNVPQSLFLAVSKQYNRKTCFDADSYLPIQSALSINYGNLNNQLSNLLQRDIFRVMKQNGYKQNLQQSMMLYTGATQNANFYSSGGTVQVYRFAAAPLLLKMATDISSSTPEYLVIGSNVQATLSLQFNTINCTGSTINANDYGILLVAVTPMTFTLSKTGNMSAISSIATSEQALVPASTQFTEDLVEGSALLGSAVLGGAVLGGSWWGKLKKGVTKAYKKYAPIAKDVLEVVPGGDKILKAADIVERGYKDISGLRGSALLTAAQKRKLYKAAQKEMGRRIR